MGVSKLGSTITVWSLAQVGAYERGSSIDDSVYVQIIEEITHPAYNPDTHEYDFRILKLGGWVRIVQDLSCLYTSDFK